MSKTTKMRVIFSVLHPAEGYIDVDAESDAEAAEMVTKLMGNNYRDLVIVKIFPIDGAPSTAKAAETPLLN